MENDEKQAKLTVPRGLNEMLDMIDKFLTYNPKASVLWDILSALRGPDSDDMELKEQTTIHIRSAAFPLTATVGSLCGIAYFAKKEDASKRLPYFAKRVNTHPHFMFHYQEAVRQLIQLNRMQKGEND